MATVKYRMNLSAKSVNHVKKLLEDYRDKLEKQVEQFCNELAEIGAEVIRVDLATHNKGEGETLGSVRIVTEGSGRYGYYKAKVQVTSDAILFIEFGSGAIHGYGAPHAGEFGMGPGTYPSEVIPQDPTGKYENWNNPNGWHYYGNDGKLHWSDGMTPTYPMYKGGKAMEEKIEEIARKVFG